MDVKLAEEKWIFIGIFIVVAEIFNQTTYYFFNRYPKFVLVKGVVLLSLFFVLTGIYLYMVVNLPITKNYNDLWTNVSIIIVNIAISLFLPFYSFSSNIRFWLLYGKFANKIYTFFL